MRMNYILGRLGEIEDLAHKLKRAGTRKRYDQIADNIRAEVGKIRVALADQNKSDTAAT